MNIAICEDEYLHAQTLAAQIRSYFQTAHCNYDLTVYANGDELLTAREPLDLVFLDWRLPDGTGQTVAEALRKKEDAPTIVFVSAYPEYVFDSFEVSPFWYLVKPVSDEKLRKTMDSFLAYFDRDLTMEFPTSDGKVFLHLCDIMYIEARRKHAIIRSCKPSPEGWSDYECTKPLAELAAMIRSPKFFRTHKCFLINMDHIERVENELIYTSNGEKVQISRRNRTAFEKAYSAYLKHSI